MSKLPQAPLQEVIFEVRWDLDVDPESNQMIDNGFDMGVGAFKTLCKDEFHLSRRKVHADMPARLLFHQVVYQYWKGEGEWPVIQLGPGIFTINDTEKNYDWDNFYPLIKKGLDWLEKAYGYKLNYNYLTLRYIDTVKMKEFTGSSLEEFVKKNFNFSFENHYNTRGALKQLLFDQVFDLDEKGGLHIAFSNGKDKEKKEDVFVWQTAVVKAGTFTTEDIVTWADSAHHITAQLFKDITKKDFYARFN